jgi:peptide deformylase
MRQPRLLQISQLGHPVLREMCRPVADVRAREVQELIDDMIATCIEANGVGIAAPQVYQPLRLFIVASRPNARYPDAPSMEPTAMINARFEPVGTTMVEDWEGCLSIPGLRGRVSRHEAIDVTFLDREARAQAMHLEGFVARIFQHEYDHIDGIVFTDRADPQSLVTEREFQRILAQAGR